MGTEDELLRGIWARASTLDERLAGLFEPVAGGEAQAEERLQAWISLAAEGDPERFARRLAYDGIDAQHLPALLGDVRARAQAPLPQEFELLREVLSEALREADDPPALRAPADDPALHDLLQTLPFGPALAPLLRVGQRRLARQLRAPVADAVSLPTHADRCALQSGCLRGLARRLCAQAEPALARALQAEREQQVEGCLGRLWQRVTGEAAGAFWTEHAALARAMALTVEHWLEASAELIARYVADADALARHFGPRAEGAPVDLQSDMGDAHERGRGVARLRFASGFELYYKPRPMALDLAFAELLDHARREGVVDDLRVPAVLAREGYGWVEGVQAREAVDAGEVERFFERGGALLCLAHLLDITDCHAGNLVAAGDHPLLIDLETVCHQRARDLDERYSDAERRARQIIAVSVLGTGLLPDVRMEGGVAVELGGLPTGAEGLQTIDAAAWTDIGTDAMRRVSTSTTIGDDANQLRFEGRMVSLRAFAPALKRGFERMARHVMAHREAWCAPAGPLERFAGCDARFIFRGTLVYSALLNRLASPDLAQSGIDRSLLIEALARPLVEAPTPPVIWPILAAERQAMQRGDVPLFRAPVAQAVLHIDGVPPVAGYLEGAGLQRLRDRVRALSDADIARELTFIDSALVQPLAAVPQPPRAQLDAPPADGPALRAAALDIAAQLQRTAIRGDDGSATWITASVDAEHNGLTWQTLSPGMGDGVAGIVLFLAALESSGAPPWVRELRLGAQRHLAQDLPRMVAEPLGALGGASSVAYALAHGAALTQDPAALDLAGTVVAGIPLEAIEQDEMLDVAGGVAGTLLTLSAVREVAERAGASALAQAAGERIRACARRLAAVAAASPDGVVPTVAGRVLSGISHGQSGLALALTRLRGDDGAAAVQPLVQAALARESELLDPMRGNWLDLRPEAPQACGCSWCHGAPGIGVARAALRARGAAAPGLFEDLLLAAHTTRAEPDAALDHLCCGTMGLVACSQVLGETLQDASLLADARQRAARVLARARARGAFATVVGAPGGVQGLGLFNGLAGVGYALLRLLQPGLPSLTVLE